MVGGGGAGVRGGGGFADEAAAAAFFAAAFAISACLRRLNISVACSHPWRSTQRFHSEPWPFFISRMKKGQGSNPMLLLLLAAAATAAAAPVAAVARMSNFLKGTVVVSRPTFSLVVAMADELAELTCVLSDDFDFTQLEQATTAGTRH